MSAEQNRAARRLLALLLSYHQEFGEEFGELTTQAGPDCPGSLEDLDVTEEEFEATVADLVPKGLVSREGDNCVLTPHGLTVALDEGLLNSLLPVAPLMPDHADSELEPITQENPFERVDNPPPPIPWDEYERYLSQVWPALLNGDQQGDEKVFQEFFEQHPCMLPTPYALFGRGHHDPNMHALVSQPELPGLRAKIPDFMWVANDSDAITAVLIEIEAPKKRWSTIAGLPHSDLTKAEHQLQGWRAWFAKPENVQVFLEVYDIPRRELRTREFLQRYVLIHGRRDEATRIEAFASTRASRQQVDERHMTYDRLAPSSDMRRYATIRIDRSTPDTKFRLLQVPPTFRLSPHTAEVVARWIDRERAIRGNALIERDPEGVSSESSGLLGHVGSETAAEVSLVLGVLRRVGLN